MGVDHSKVERIVENLLSNAAKYSPADTPIWVRVEAQPRGALIVVEDAGAGVPEEIRERIFEPFTADRAEPEHSPGWASACRWSPRSPSSTADGPGSRTGRGAGPVVPGAAGRRGRRRGAASGRIGAAPA